MDIVRFGLDYHDKNTEIYEHFFKRVTHVEYILTDNDTERNQVVLYEGDKKIFTSHIESLGAYYVKSRAWVWGWAHPLYYKNRTIYSRKLLNYAHNMNPSTDSYIRSILLTSRLKVDHPSQLDIYLSIGSYLTKMPMIFPHVISLRKRYNIGSGKIEYDGKIVEDVDSFVVFYYLIDYEKLDKDLL